MGNESNNALAASIDLSILEGSVFSEAYYNPDSEEYKIAAQVGYDLTETVATSAYVELYKANSAINVGGSVDFTTLPVDITPGVGYSLSDDSSVDGNYSVYVQFEYDFSL